MVNTEQYEEASQTTHGNAVSEAGSQYGMSQKSMPSMASVAMTTTSSTGKSPVQQRGAVPKGKSITYASFNGMSTNLVRETDGATIFCAPGEDNWPKKAIKKGIKTSRELLKKSNERSPSPQDRNVDVKVTLPGTVTQPGKAAPFVWSNVDVAGLDWRQFVIPPPEPPPPPPPLALKERLLEIFKLDETQKPKAKDNKDSSDEEIDFADNGVAKEIDGGKKKLMTLRERIRCCPNHNKSRVNDETWVRMMLQRHLNMNKRAGALVEEGDESESESTSSSGHALDLGDNEWVINDPKFLAAEKDKIAERLREVQGNLEATKLDDGKKIDSQRQEIRRLRKAMGLPLDSDDEDYEDALKVAKHSRKHRDSDKLPNRVSFEGDKQQPPVVQSPSSSSSSSSSHYQTGSDPGEQAITGPEADLVWAERELGFMGVHRGNILTKKEDVEEHVQMLANQGLPKDAANANTGMQITCFFFKKKTNSKQKKQTNKTAMSILLSYAGEADEEIEFAQELLHQLGITWYNADIKKPLIDKEASRLSNSGQSNKASDIKRAGVILTRYLETMLKQALLTLSTHDINSSNFLKNRDTYFKALKEYQARGAGDRRSEILKTAYTDVRRRRRELIEHASTILQQQGIEAETSFDIKEKKSSMFISKYKDEGNPVAVKSLQQAVSSLKLQLRDSNDWAVRVMSKHNVEKDGKAAMQKAKKTLETLVGRDRGELQLAWNLTEYPSLNHDLRLLDSDDGLSETEGDTEKAKVARRRRAVSLHAEVERLKKSGQYKEVTLENGKKVHMAKDGKIVNLTDVARTRLELMGIDPNAEVEVKNDGTPVVEAPNVPFTDIVREELMKLRASAEKLDKATMEKQARKNAKARIRASSKIMNIPSANRNWSEADMIGSEVRRLISTGEWKEATDDRDGRMYFIKNKTGEVQFNLEKVARENLEKEGVLLTDSDDDKAIDEAEESESKADSDRLIVNNIESSLGSNKFRLGRDRSDTLTSDVSSLQTTLNDTMNKLHRHIDTVDPSEIVIISQKEQQARHFRSRLIQYLRQTDPTKLDKLDEMLRGWKGEEEEMFRYLDVYYDRKRRGLPGSPLRRRPKKTIKQPRNTFAEKAAFVDSVIANPVVRNPEEFRKLLIKLLAMSNPDGLKHVADEVRLNRNRSSERLSELVDAFGVDAAFNAWRQQISVASVPTAKDELNTALVSIAGGPGKGEDGKVLPSQLSPLFALEESPLIGGGNPSDFFDILDETYADHPLQSDILPRQSTSVSHQRQGIKTVEAATPVKPVRRKTTPSGPSPAPSPALSTPSGLDIPSPPRKTRIMSETPSRVIKTPKSSTPPASVTGQFGGYNQVHDIGRPAVRQHNDGWTPPRTRVPETRRFPASPSIPAEQQPVSTPSVMELRNRYQYPRQRSVSPPDHWTTRPTTTVPTHLSPRTRSRERKQHIMRQLDAGGATGQRPTTPGVRQSQWMR